MKLIQLIGLLVIAQFLFADAQYPLTEGVFRIGATTPVTGQNDMSFTLTRDAQKISFAVIPCFGAFTWCVENGQPVDFSQPWNMTCCFNNSGNQNTQRCGDLFVRAPRTFYVSVKSILGPFTGRTDVGSIFDIVTYDNTTDLLSLWVPTPGGGGNVDLEVTEAKTKRDPVTLSMTFEGTGSTSDSYSLWQYDGIISDEDGWRYTACGIKQLFSRMSTDLYNVTQNGNSYTFSIGNLKYNKQATYVVIVERLNGYYAAYEAAVFNNSFYLVPSLVLLAILSLLFM